MGVASYLATRHVAPYVCLYVCGWIFGWGVSTRCSLWKQSHWDIQEHGGAFDGVYVCVFVCVCKIVRCTELQRPSAPTPPHPPPRLQGSSLLADPHLLVVRSRLSLHVSVIMLETVVLQVGKAEQLRGENEKVTTHSWGLHFETVNTRQPTNDDGTVSSLIIPLRCHCIIWKLVRRSRRCWILGLFVTDTADNGHHLKSVWFLTGLKDVKTFSSTSSRVFFPQEEM